MRDTRWNSTWAKTAWPWISHLIIPSKEDPKSRPCFPLFPECGKRTKWQKRGRVVRKVSFKKALKNCAFWCWEKHRGKEISSGSSKKHLLQKNTFFILRVSRLFAWLTVNWQHQMLLQKHQMCRIAGKWRLIPRHTWRRSPVQASHYWLAPNGWTALR